MSNFTRNKIDNITQIAPEQITRENLRFMYGTGQEIASKNSQGVKVSRYRSGVQTKLGDIEASIWMELVEKLIDLEKEREIFEQLFEWEKDTYNIQSKTRKDLLFEAMKSYTYRIYDNKVWWDYVRFNRKYHPEVLEHDADLIAVRFACCNNECRIPVEQIRHEHEVPDTVPCPFCNRGSKFTIINDRME